MPIPDFQSLLLPVLSKISDGAEHRIKDIIEELAVEYKLTSEERKQLLPSERAFLFDNRVHWARFYLKKAGLVNTFKRGTITITNNGLAVIKQNPKSINLNFLRQYPEFNEGVTTKEEALRTNIEAIPSVTTDIGTPEEILENSYLKIREALCQDILSRIISLSPNYFEKLVVELLVKMGYGGSLKDAGRVIGKSGDEGIDGTIKEDKLGLDIIYIQAKRWKTGNVVGRPDLQQFVGALAGQGAKKGIFITTSSFSKEAKSYVPRNETKIVLIDGELLANYMIDYNIGVTLQQTFEIKKIDSDYFEEN
jgi:restriction system protein